MPNYGFEKADNEVLANRMFKARCVFATLATITLAGPIMLIVSGETAEGDVMNSNKWWSVPILDDEDFVAMKNPFVCSRLQSGSCATGSVSNWKKTKCFTFHKEHKTYDEAKQVCLSEYGTLASIESQEDTKQFSAFCKDDAPCWMGLYRSPGSDEWQWMDGSPIVYKNWGHQHPLEKWKKDDLGAYAIWGYKRWAASMMLLMGATSTIMISLHVLFIGLLCGVMHKALEDKKAQWMFCVASFDGFQAFWQLVVLILAFVALGAATGAGIAGGILYIFFGSAEFLLVAYLVFAGCRMKKELSAPLEFPEAEDRE